MYEILCFGDSNTWGYRPENAQRYDRKTRWTGVLQKALGKGFFVMEEGLNGRTTVWDDPVEEGKNGSRQLLPCLESHKPLSLVILMLGTNDLKDRYSVPAIDIANSIGRLIEIIKKSNTGEGGKAPAILLLAPPPLGEISTSNESFAHGKAKSAKLGLYYENIACEKGCHFFNTASIIESSPVDGVHLSEKSHQILGTRLAEIVKNILLTQN
ncbi:hydrolase [candidate division KSB3 bacterium]|uniref:Hydrolase n=1 Tax=candidate division KSB3 bacterium TaxID=2044937 RepID=A0A2G6E077_9BACT|nr:MAG: hydrolase [candidate division KSB3 bacterium]